MCGSGHAGVVQMDLLHQLDCCCLWHDVCRGDPREGWIRLHLVRSDLLMIILDLMASQCGVEPGKRE